MFPHKRYTYAITVPQYGTVRNTGYESIRNSDPGVLPITSILLLNSVTSDINGAQIYCTGYDVGSFNRHTMPATMIHSTFISI